MNQNSIVGKWRQHGNPNFEVAYRKDGTMGQKLGPSKVAVEVIGNYAHQGNLLVLNLPKSSGGPQTYASDVFVSDRHMADVVAGLPKGAHQGVVGTWASRNSYNGNTQTKTWKFERNGRYTVATDFAGLAPANIQSGSYKVGANGSVELQGSNGRKENLTLLEGKALVHSYFDRIG